MYNMEKSLTEYAHNNMACDQWDPRLEMGASVQSDLDLLLLAAKVLKNIETLLSLYYRLQHDNRALYRMGTAKVQTRVRIYALLQNHLHYENMPIQIN